MAVVPAVPESWWDEVQDYASRAVDVAAKIEKVVDAPEYDLAAVLNVDVAWIMGTLFGVKVLWAGFAFLSRRKKSRR